MEYQLQASVRRQRTVWQVVVLALLLMMVSGLATARSEQQPKTPENLLKAAQKGETNTVRALLAAGADMNARNKDGQTALMIACKNGHVDTVKALLSAGADLYAKDKNSETALSLAEKNKGKNQNVLAETLKEHIRLQLLERKQLEERQQQAFHGELLAKGKEQSYEVCNLLRKTLLNMTTDLAPGGSVVFTVNDVNSIFAKGESLSIYANGVYTYPYKNMTVFKEILISSTGGKKRFGKTAIVDGKCYDLPEDTKILGSQ